MRELILSATVCICLFSSSIFATGGDMGGPTQDGSAEFPYLIEDFNDFQAFCANPNYWAADVYTQLDCNLDLDPNLPGRIICNQAPIAGGVNATAYAGNFDGKGHFISNLAVDGGYCCGLFGKTASGSSITDLSLENASVIGSGDNVGGLVGYNNSSITGSYSTGAVTGESSVGGLVGFNHNGSISSSYSIGAVAGVGYSVGGLVGWNDDGRITNSYSTGAVTGWDSLGGLVGRNDGGITSCYATGTVTGDELAGGLVGINRAGSVTSSFWDIQTSTMLIGVNSGAITNVTGKTTLEMQTLSTFTDAGWDFIDTWDIGENQTYPFLRKYAVGDLDHNGIVNLDDFAVFADNWLVGIE